ncbi:MAG TPA: hypothetical protein VK706_16865 [Candidatus Sulfotelmatobacter sp.]|nr:hypothetical protein [Candidatus Sulfotelmatobacter sp.]
MPMSNGSNADPKRELLRHTLATLAYRGGKAIRNAPEGFAVFHIDEGVRAPGQILAHVGDLMDWGLSMAIGKPEWHDSKPLAWESETERFFAALKKFDDYMASQEPLQAPVEKLFQGPIADALTHVGQIAILRRLAGEPVKAENFYKAEIVVGRVGAEQTSRKKEF